MSGRWRRTLVLGAAFLGLTAGVRAQEPAGDEEPERPKAKAAEPKGKAKDGEKGKGAEAPKLAKATFGGGCFWCLEAVYERLPGVKSVVSGYSGGRSSRPNYQAVSAGLTGHAEVVQIEYDPKVIPYEKLLEVFFTFHDPTTLNRQGPDEGTQYRSIILCHDEDQQRAAHKAIERLNAGGVFSDPIVTEVVPFKAFYPAEKHHQDYYRRNRNAPYCRMYIAPKVEKLRHILSEEAATPKAR